MRSAGGPQTSCAVPTLQVQERRCETDDRTASHDVRALNALYAHATRTIHPLTLADADEDPEHVPVLKL